MNGYCWKGQAGTKERLITLVLWDVTFKLLDLGVFSAWGEKGFDAETSTL